MKKNETELTSLDPKFKNVVIKILKELKKLIDRNTVHCDKELETTKRSQLKLDKSIAKMKIKQMIKTLIN